MQYNLLEMVLDTGLLFFNLKNHIICRIIT